MMKGKSFKEAGRAMTRALENKTSGQRQKRYEMEANPEMHAVKNSMRRKGLPDHKIFHHALRQADSYNKKHGIS